MLEKEITSGDISIVAHSRACAAAPLNYMLVKVKRILLIVIVLIVYGSLYPWRFQAPHLTASPISILLHSWPDTIDRFFMRDLVINVVLYIPFGAFCFLAMRGPFRWILTIVAAAALSSSIEMAQLFDSSRVCSLFDVLCNTAGAAIGVVLAAAFPAKISGVVRGAEELGAFRFSGQMALLYLWIGAQLFPFFPALTQHALRAKLAVLFSAAAWPARDFLESLAAWLAVCVLLDRFAGAKHFRRILSIALLSISLKLFIAQRTITGSEVVGALLAIACWFVARRFRRPVQLAAILSLAAIAAAGLLPFHWSDESQAFTWIPFLPMLKMPWIGGMQILLQKNFLYGSIVWLFRESGRGWLPSILIVAAPLAMIEALQIHLPGRTPEVTDPLLAVILGATLMLMERERKPVVPLD